MIFFLKLTITENKYNCIGILFETCGYCFCNADFSMYILKFSLNPTDATYSILKLIATTWPKNSPLILY